MTLEEVIDRTYLKLEKFFFKVENVLKTTLNIG